MNKERSHLILLLAVVLSLRFLPVVLSGLKIPGVDIFRRSIFAKEIVSGAMVSHPPLYYWTVAKLHTVTGIPILTLNTISAYVFSILAPFVAYYVGKEFFDHRSGLIAGFSIVLLSSGIYLEFIVFQINNLINAFVLIPLVLLAFKRTQEENFSKLNYIYILVGTLMITTIHGLTSFWLLGMVLGIGILYIFPMPFWKSLDNRNLNVKGYAVLLFGVLLGLGLMWNVYTQDRVEHVTNSTQEQTPDIQLVQTPENGSSGSGNSERIQQKISGFIDWFIASPYSIIVSFNKFTSAPLFLLGGVGLLAYFFTRGIDEKFIILASWVISLTFMMFVGLKISNVSPLRFIKDISFPLSILTGFTVSRLLEKNIDLSNSLYLALSVLVIVSALFHTGQQIQPDVESYKPDAQRQEAIEFLSSNENVTRVLPTRDAGVLNYYLDAEVLSFRKADGIQSRIQDNWVWRFRMKQGYIFRNPDTEKAKQYLDDMKVSHIYIVKDSPFPSDYQIEESDLGDFSTYEKVFENSEIKIYKVKDAKK